MRAELAGAVPLRSTSRATLSGNEPVASTEDPPPAPADGADTQMTTPDGEVEAAEPSPNGAADDTPINVMEPQPDMDTKHDKETAAVDASTVVDLIASATSAIDREDQPHGVKRPIDEVEAETPSAVEEEPEVEVAKPALKVNADGTVEQEDTVKYVFKTPPVLFGMAY